MTNNLIEKYNNTINAVVATHTELKIKTQLAYELAIEHAKNCGDWFLFADFITKLLNNRITTPKHLFNIMKKTNEGLQYNRQKASIKQSEQFDVNKTVVLQNIWSDELTETTKNVVVFDEKKLLNSLQIALNKALKNNIQKETIKQQVVLALGWLESK